MNKAQDQKFLKISVAVLVIAALVFFVPGWIDSWQGAKKKRDAEKAVEVIQEVGTPAPRSKVGVVVDGENAGMEVDMSEALLIEDVKEGEGAEVVAGDNIVIHYHGTLEDGTVFDSSRDRNEPFETTIGVGQLIQGWDEGVPGMKVGGIRRLTIPPAKGYGDQEMPTIPAGSTLIFEVELLEIK